MNILLSDLYIYTVNIGKSQKNYEWLNWGNPGENAPLDTPSILV